MPHVLALDLARESGAAWRDSATGAIRTLAFCLGRPNTHGEQLGSHLRELQSIVATLLADTGCDVVSIEMDTGRGAGSGTLRAYHVAARMTADAAGARVIAKLNASAARKRALGNGGLSKTEADRMGRMILRLPADVTNDEVDAAILLDATETWLREEAWLAEVKTKARAHARSRKRPVVTPVRRIAA